MTAVDWLYVLGMLAVSAMLVALAVDAFLG